MAIGRSSILVGGIAALVAAIRWSNEPDPALFVMGLGGFGIMAIYCFVSRSCADSKYRWQLSNTSTAPLPSLLVIAIGCAMFIALDPDPMHQYPNNFMLAYPLVAVCMIYERGSWDRVARVLYAILAPLATVPLNFLSAGIVCAYNEPDTPPASLAFYKIIAVLAVYPVVLFSMRRSCLFVASTQVEVDAWARSGQH